MKQSEYIPISQRENIEDENVAKILDYLERHAKKFEFISPVQYRVDRNILTIDKDYFIFRDDDYKKWLSIPTHILAENIVWIYGSLKNIQ